MKKLYLILEILKSYTIVEKASKITMVVIASKYIVTNKNLGLNWYDITSKKERFIDGLNAISKITNLQIIGDKEVIEVLSTLSEDVFQKLISNCNEDYSDIEETKLIRTLYSMDRINSQYVTPDTILNLAIQMLDVKGESSVIDSFAGLLGVCETIKKYSVKKGFEFGTIKFSGQELNSELFPICELINYILSEGNCRVVNGDSIENPAFTASATELDKFDYAISNAPFNIIRIPSDYRDNYSRFRLAENGYLRANNNSWITVEHIVATLNDKGKAAILLPMGPLFRSTNTDKTIRKAFVNEDIIECIVKLPEGIWSYTGIATVMLIVNKNKEECKKNKIQFIDLSNSLELVSRRERKISEEALKKAVEVFNNNEESNISFIVDKEYIANKDYNLDIFNDRENKKLSDKIGSWETIKLKEVATVRRGVQLTKGKIEILNKEKEKSHYLVGIGNVVDGKIVVGEEDKIAVDDRMKDLYQVEAGDIVLTSKGSILKIALIDESVKNAIISSNLCIIRVNSNKYKAVVLKYFLESKIGTRLLESIWKGAVIRSLSNKDLENLPLPNMNIEYQELLEEMIIKSINEYENTINMANDKFKQEQDEILKKMKF